MPLGHLGPNFYSTFVDDLYAIVYNSTSELYLRYIIDDYCVNLHNENIEVKIWSHKQTYPIDFPLIFNSILEQNGFRGWNEHLSHVPKNTKTYEIKLHSYRKQ